MNKNDFLRRLDRELSVLDKNERKELLDFYEERFYSGKIYEHKTEQEIIADLESPEVIARNILSEYGVSPKHVKSKEERYSGIETSSLLILIIFDVLVATWLIPSLFSAAFAILGSLLSYIGVVPLLFGNPTDMDVYFFLLLTGIYFLLFLFGLLVLDLSIYVTKKVAVWHMNVFKLKNREKWIKKLHTVSIDNWFKKRRLLNFVKGLATIASFVVIVYSGYMLFSSDSNYIDELINAPRESVEYKEDVSLDITNGDVWTISTEFDNMVVEVVKSNVSEIKVVRTYQNVDDDFEIDIDVENNTLTMSNDFENQFFWSIKDIFSQIFRTNKVIIYVPEDLVIDRVNIETGNGAVSVNDLVVTDLDVTTMNGTITIDNVVVDSDMTLKTLNGRVIVEDVFGGTHTLKASTSNGQINLDTVEFAMYDLDTSNGKIIVKNANEDQKDGITLNADTSNGDIDLENVYVKDVDVRTMNGDIDFYNEDTTFVVVNFDYSTTNGSVRDNVRN